MGTSTAVLGGQPLTVAVRAGPGTPATATITLYAPLSRGGGQLYTATANGTIGSDGRATIAVPVSYAPNTTMRDATLVVLARTACGADSQRLRVDILPGTGAPQPRATSTPAVATATAAARVAATATAMPRPTSTKVPTATATRTTLCAAGADPRVFVTLYHSKIYGRYIVAGEGLAVAVHAAAGSTVAVARN